MEKVDRNQTQISVGGRVIKTLRNNQKGNPRNQKHCNRNRESVEWSRPREEISKLENISTETSQIEMKREKGKQYAKTMRKFQ